MLNNDRIRLMTKLALYESKAGKEDISLGKYYKTDYVRYQIIKSVICATVGYALILVLIMLYRSEFLIGHAVTLNYQVIGTNVLGIYVMIVAAYGLGTAVVSSIKYDKSRKKLGKYYKSLKRLNKLYNDETPEA